MRYQKLPASFHAQNRHRLAKSIGDDAIAIIDTADELSRPGDYEYPFRPDSNFYYLTGVDEPEAVLLLVPGHANAAARELLFTSGTSDFVGTWQGDRLTSEQAADISGIKNVLPLDQLDFYLGRLLQQFQTVYLNAPETPGSIMPHPSQRRAQILATEAPLHQLKSVLPFLGAQRTIKDPVEIGQIQRAIDITAGAFSRAWSTAKAGLYEDAIEAELTAEFTRQGTVAAWPPVVAAGPRANVIHYSSNSQILAKDDLMLIDIGAEYGFYAADVSRTTPVSGRFTDRQRQVYAAVYKAQRAGIALHKPGTSIFEVHEAMSEILTHEVASLGLKGKLFDYFPYTSHHLGLDIHDTGGHRQKLEPGMVVTCEPGLHLKDEGIGVRLEDDILITPNGYEILSRNIPSDPDEIEDNLKP